MKFSQIDSFCDAANLRSKASASDDVGYKALLCSCDVATAGRISCTSSTEEEEGAIESDDASSTDDI